MAASILVCHYVKHGMTCVFGAEGVVDVCLLIALIGFCAVMTIWAGAAKR